MVLPAAAMPWGRWLQGEQEETSRQLEALRMASVGDSGSFATRSDNMARQISAIDALSEIKQVNVPNFSGSVTAAPSDPRLFIIASPEYIIQAPLLRSVSARVIVNFNTASSPTNAITFFRPVLRVNGQNTRAELMYPNLTSTGSVSIAGTFEASAGASLSIAFGIGVGQGSSASVTVSNCSIWVAFYGSIS